MSIETKSVLTSFEDLSNEILYEIFDYCDFSFIHETFSSLNERFHRLLNYSTLPIHIDFQLISKTLFYRRCEQILFPNENRVASLKFIEHFHLEYFLEHFTLNSNFVQLQRIVVDRVKFDQCDRFFLVCDTLPRLEHLSIRIIDQIKCPNRIFDSILRLAHLKSCRIDIDLPDMYDDSSFILTQSSPIESLTIIGHYHLDDLIELLVWTPKLRSLTSSISSSNSDQLEIFVVPPNLHSIDFILENISFDEFEWFLKKFSHQIDQCSLTIHNAMEFLDCQRWERFLSEHLPNLVRFSLYHYLRISEHQFNIHHYHHLIDQFPFSSFFSQRRISFFHQHHSLTYPYTLHRFYTIEPFRGKEFDFIDNYCEEKDFQENFAEKILIYHSKVMERSAMNFPRAKSLVYSDDQSSRYSTILNALSFRLNLQLINELTLNSDQLRFEHLMIFLQHLTNLNLLTIPTTILHLATPQSKSNSFHFRNTTIKRLILVNSCQFPDIHIVTHLFHSLHSLDVKIFDRDFSTVISYLLRHHFKRNSSSTKTMIGNVNHSFPSCFGCKTNRLTSQSHGPTDQWACAHLTSICCRDVSFRTVKQLKETLFYPNSSGDCSIEYFNEKMFLWW